VPNAGVLLVDLLEYPHGAIWSQARADEEKRSAGKQQAFCPFQEFTLPLGLRFAVVGVVVRPGEGATNPILPVSMELDKNATIPR
jgi:hypothetical protein